MGAPWPQPPPPPPSNFVFSCLIIMKFGVLIDFDKFSLKSRKKFLNDVTAELSRHLFSGYCILWNFEIIYFWTDLVEGWLKGKIMSADFESGVIFYIGDQYQGHIGHYLQFWVQKSDRCSLSIELLWQQFKPQMNKTYILDALYIDSNSLEVLLFYC